jgi:hypothetical protein
MAYTETERERLQKLYASLDAERGTFLSHWRDLADHTLPRRLRMSVTDVNKGDKRNQKIVDSTATLAVRTLKSGMMAGITSPARPWMRLVTPDPDLNERRDVRDWLHLVTQRMHTVFLRSNLYNALPTLYGDQGVFATGAMAALDDVHDVARFQSIPIGSYMMAVNDRDVVDTFVRDLPMTVRQVVRKFVNMNDPESRRWRNVSQTVRDLWDNGNLNSPVHVVQSIYANADYDPRYIDPKYKKYTSVYHEAGSDAQDRLLLKSGYDDFPILAPRWDVTAGDVYGTSCPGMDALGDIRALQLMQRRKAEAVEKMVRPPMVGPSSLRTAKASILPGDITFIDVREGQQKFQPIYEVNPRIAEMVSDIREHQQRISRVFYEDLFLMLAQSDRREITAREIDERHEEKLLMLGPTLERENDELLDPLIARVFNIMDRRGMIPPAPEVLQEQAIKVEYISIMAQAQKMVAMSGLERFTGFVGNMAKAVPNVMDKVDTDNMVDEYADMTGVSPRILNTDEQANEKRAQRQQAEQEKAAAENQARQAQAQRDMAQADLSNNNLQQQIGV